MQPTRRAVLAAAAGSVLQGQSRFRWPEGRRCAVSLTFDDARLSQPDVAVPLLRRCGVKGTFYLSPDSMAKRLDGWKAAVAAGHEIGNHSRSHPCTANYRFSAANGLEGYTLARMEQELDGGNDDIERALGVKPVSFAYPCGQKFVGRGEETQSYVPLVAKKFLTGRGYLDEAANDPLLCDFAQLMGTGCDGLTLDEMQKLVAGAASEGRWLVFVSHEVGQRAPQTTDAEALEQICRFAKEPRNGIWVDTVRNVARYVLQQRRSG